MASDRPHVHSAGDTPGPRLLTAADWQRLAAGPTPLSLAAFGVDGTRLTVLPGGQGNTWSDGRIVLTSVGFEPECDWVSDVYARWTAHDVVRVPEPVPGSVDGGNQPKTTWVVEGWAAHVFMPGRDAEVPSEVEAIREASDLFHGLVAHLERPDWLDARDDPWAYGDRLAWDGAEPIGAGQVRTLTDTLLAALAPVTSPSQIVHGDILPNVLLDARRPPAVIDWPPYHRPAGFANAVAVTDAVTFRGAPMSLLDSWADGPEWPQLLVRALLYRLGPTSFFTVRNSLMGGLVTHADRVAPVVDAVLERT